MRARHVLSWFGTWNSSLVEFCLRPPLHLFPVLRQGGEEAIRTALSERRSAAEARAGKGTYAAARPGEAHYEHVFH